MVIRVWEAVVKLRSQEGQAEGCLTGTQLHPGDAFGVS